MGRVVREQLRQHYLQAFGIETYVPRWVLPGAAVSPVLVWEEGDDESVLAVDSADIVAGSTNPQVESAIAPVLESVSEGRIALSDELRSPAKRNRIEGPIQVSAQTVPEHRFALRAWRIRDDLMVLDSWQAKLALPVDQLLLNISIALGCGISSLPRPETLRWPLLQTAAAPASPNQSVDEARAMVHAYLAAQHEKQAIGTLLLMGTQAMRHGLHARELTSDEPASRLLGQSFSIPLGNLAGSELSADGGGQGAVVQGIVLPSLAALLQKPSLKALAWKAIKHLRVSH